MKKIVIQLLLSISIISTATDIPYIDFDSSMKLSEFPHSVQNPSYAQLYHFFKNLYETFSPATISYNEQTRIPKMLHWIWLGSPLPDKYKQLIDTWIALHPDWSFKIWTDADVPYFHFTNKDMFDTAKNYGEKSDIWRYEILEQFGGVYADIDFECLRNIEAFNHAYDFFIGMQPLDTHRVQLGIGLIGSIPHHPILRVCIKTLPNNKHISQIIVRTGPIYFTNIFTQVAGKTGHRDIAMPASYFYPCGYEQRGMNKNVWQQPESYAIHHWAGSWLEPQAFERK